MLLNALTLAKLYLPFLCALPKISTDWEKNWHQYVWKLAPIYLQFAPIYIFKNWLQYICNLRIFFTSTTPIFRWWLQGWRIVSRPCPSVSKPHPSKVCFDSQVLLSTINYWIAILKKTQLIRSGLPRARAPQLRAARQSSSSRPSSSDPPSARNKLGRSRPSSITGLPRWWEEMNFELNQISSTKTIWPVWIYRPVNVLRRPSAPARSVWLTDCYWTRKLRNNPSVTQELII